MKNLYLLFLLLGAAMALPTRSQAQGCVAIRHYGSCGSVGGSGLLPKGEWQVGANYRYFRSFRHFRGHEEEPDRVANHSEVINWSHALDLSVTYALTDRLFATASLPVVYNDRSSLYEHGRQSRHLSSSRGLGDARIGMGYWLLPEANHPNGNLSVSLGLKLPTGNYRAEDVFYNVGPDGTSQVRPVDQSIQPGDGGVGLTVEAQHFQKVVNRLFAYANGFYLVNPRETNGTRTFRETLSPLLVNEAIMSVPDQYALRAGLTYATPLSGLALSVGGRLEGVPVRDLVGGSAGFRRPGYALSVDPGLNYMHRHLTFTLNVPVALLRNRQQSVTDKEIERQTNQPRHGDAAFADYLISAGVSFRLGREAKAAPLPVQAWPPAN